jgi:hypothetical protein
MGVMKREGRRFDELGRSCLSIDGGLAGFTLFCWCRKFGMCHPVLSVVMWWCGTAGFIAGVL